MENIENKTNSVETTLGEEANFWNFVNNNIRKQNTEEKDKIGIITHNDLDGIASGVFLEEILKNSNLETEETKITGIDKKEINQIIENFKEKQINKIFILDIAIESIYPELIENTNEDFQIFLIDHHPKKTDEKKPQNTIKKSRILKTDSSDCVALTLFRMGIKKDLIDEKEWAWLACSAGFSEFSYDKKENLEFIQKYYPDFKKESASTTTPGIIARKIASSLIYYKNQEGTKKVYELVKKKDIEELAEAQREIEDEISRKIDTFFDNAEVYKDKSLYLYKIDSPYRIKSYLSTMISKLNPESTFIIYNFQEDKAKISARNQSKNRDVNQLLRESVKNLENAQAGGHKSAAAATIKKDDFEKFKENLLNHLE